ncbi:NAD-dependent epimerase/dehydratase family protein [Rhizobium mayense]|uniref:NAD-dependent epimerase/dehydratase family protein n=1 Tax=Rhizobium mayense TaxID=1312184 RepID=A0ABT7K7D2_9HYPH|nr:NAD-dependent epimerase/dehydratase family protein [Rhizobium mayense]MDL2403908.1 NAD-dependent epimerase/dehydratase family protein [Rhizobium mayense]
MGTCLIFGINSFTGRYVSRVFQEHGHDVVGTSFSGLGDTDYAGAKIHRADLLDYEVVSRIIKETRPEFVVNLAGISFIINSDVSQFYNVHILGTRNILASLVEHKVPVSKVVLASSAQVYGSARNPDETTPGAPLNDYGVSKLGMEHMARIWSDKLPIIIARPFNCIGVGQSKNFLVSKILNAFVAKDSNIELGDTKISRDFIDIRLAAQYYFLLATKGSNGETYNIGSGKSHSIDCILGQLTKISGHQMAVHFNPTFVRPNDPSSITANTTKIMSLPNSTGPTPLEETLMWMYENARRD